MIHLHQIVVSNRRGLALQTHSLLVIWRILTPPPSPFNICIQLCNIKGFEKSSVTLLVSTVSSIIRRSHPIIIKAAPLAPHLIVLHQPIPAHHILL